MVWKPDVTVAAVVEADGRYLVVEERIRHRLVFNQPAGHLEDDESVLDAVIRETREETARELSPSALVGIYLWRDPVSGRATLRFTFTGSVGERDPAQPLDYGIVATHWLSRDELLARETRLRSPLVMRCIDDYVRGVRLPLDAVSCIDFEDAARIRAVSL